MQEVFTVGVVTGPFGLKGEVKVHVLSDDPDRLLTLKSVTLRMRRTTRELEIEHVRKVRQYTLVKFCGLNRIEDVEEFRNAELTVDREHAIPLEENEYYIGDLIGLTVELEDRSVLGQLSDVIVTGANDVYVVKQEGAKELLIPAIAECIRSVDLENGTITVRLLKGLAD